MASEFSAFEEAVRPVLLDLLETTADDETWLNLSPDEVSELQAAIWQTLVHLNEQEMRLAGLRAGMVVLLEGTAP